MKMNRNVGLIDRVFRVGVVAILIYISLVVVSDWVASTILLTLAAINIYAVVFGSCPLYNLVRFSSCMCKDN